MRLIAHSVLKRYGLASVLASLALLIRGALPVPEGTTIYQLPIVAVVLSGWFGGRGPGLFASLICAATILYRFIPPADSFELSSDYALGFLIFIALCLLLSEFGSGRRRAAHASRASEERFRALVQFSFDVYWETDTKHRFTRQEFSERLTEAPARGSELGKTRWEIPYVEPDEEAWRKHRATLDAHLPFRDFELARPNVDALRWVPRCWPQHHRAQARRGGAPELSHLPGEHGPHQPHHAGNPGPSADAERRPSCNARHLRLRPSVVDIPMRS
jgi:PAS domain-containing protein